MRKSLLMLGILFSCCSSVLIAQSPFFSMHYVETGEISDETTHITTQDGGNLIASVQHPSMATNYFITLIKTDADGVIQWTKKFPTDRPGFRNVVQSTDGSYFLCYSEFPFGNYYEAIRLDQNGNVIFNKRINLPALHHVTWKTSVVPKFDSGYYVGCSIFDTATSMYQWDLMEISASGNVVWTKNYNADGFLGALTGMELCYDGDVLLLGSEYDIPTQSYCGMITRVTAAGNFLWNTRFGYTGHDIYPLDAEAQGSGLIVSIQDYQQSAGMAAVDFLQIDSMGVIGWATRYTNTGPNSSLLPHDLIVSGGGQFVVVAQRSGPQPGSVFLQVDASGQYVSSRFYPDYTITSIDNYGQWMYSLTGTRDSLNDHFAALKTVDGVGTGCNDTTAAFGFGPVSFTTTSGGTAANFSLAAINGNLTSGSASLFAQTLCTLTAIQENNEYSSTVSLYPIPATNTLSVASAHQIVNVTLFDSKGSLMLNKTVQNSSCEIDITGLTPGLYLITVEFENHIESRRLVIE